MQTSDLHCEKWHIGSSFNNHSVNPWLHHIHLRDDTLRVVFSEFFVEWGMNIGWVTPKICFSCAKMASELGVEKQKNNLGHICSDSRCAPFDTLLLPFASLYTCEGGCVIFLCRMSRRNFKTSTLPKKKRINRAAEQKKRSCSRG